MNNIYVLTMATGTTLTPVAAGYITVDLGWRWLWWILAIILGGALVAFFFGYEETKFTSLNGVSFSAHSIDESEDQKENDQKAADITIVDSHTATPPPPRKSYLERLKPWSASEGSLLELSRHAYQPFVVMVTIPAVLYVALLYGLVTAALQISVTLISTSFPAPPYNFNAAQVGLMSLPMLIGTILGTVVSTPFVDRIILYLAHKNNGIYEPEMRLWILFIFAPFFPAGLIWFGYALHGGMSWPIVAVALGMFSFAMPPISSVALTYLTDSYKEVSV